MMRIDALELLDALDRNAKLRQDDRKVLELFHSMPEQSKELVISLMTKLSKENDDR